MEVKYAVLDTLWKSALKLSPEGKHIFDYFFAATNVVVDEILFSEAAKVHIKSVDTIQLRSIYFILLDHFVSNLIEQNPEYAFLRRDLLALFTEDAGNASIESHAGATADRSDPWDEIENVLGPEQSSYLEHHPFIRLLTEGVYSAAEDHIYRR